jgi:hypothetical protein
MFIEEFGERGTNRTFNLLIKSSLSKQSRFGSIIHSYQPLTHNQAARKRFDVVLKRSTLARMGLKRTAHLRHSCSERAACLRCELSMRTSRARNEARVWLESAVPKSPYFRLIEVRLALAKYC